MVTVADTIGSCTASGTRATNGSPASRRANASRCSTINNGINKRPFRFSTAGLVAVGCLCLAFASCHSAHDPTCRTEGELPARHEPPLERLTPPVADQPFQQVCYETVHAEVPKPQGAEYVNDTDICATCHETYVKTFADNVHRRDNCEACHGPASRHVETRGQEPGLIFSFKKGNPAVLAEACCVSRTKLLQPRRQWRTSKHAHCGVTCVSCHRAHYNVPPGTPATTAPGGAANGVQFQHVAAHFVAETKKAELPSLRGTTHNLGAFAPGVCYRCHCDKKDLEAIAGPHQICGPNGFNCTTCHDPHGNLKESSRKDLCLSCHNGTAPTMAWHSSIHERDGVFCTDCHNPHPNSHVQQMVAIDHYGIKQPKMLADVGARARDVLQVSPQDLRPDKLAVASPDLGRQDGLLGLPRPARAVGTQLEGRDRQPALLQVSRGETGPVCLPAPASG